jgi:hypothetical protein
MFIAFAKELTVYKIRHYGGEVLRGSAWLLSPYHTPGSRLNLDIRLN